MFIFPSTVIERSMGLTSVEERKGEIWNKALGVQHRNGYSVRRREKLRAIFNCLAVRSSDG